LPARFFGWQPAARPQQRTLRGGFNVDVQRQLNRLQPHNWHGGVLVKLDAFIRTNMEAILQEWENFARTLGPSTRMMEELALRDDAQQMLGDIAEDMATDQSESERLSKSRGEAGRVAEATAATVHGGLRFTSQFSICQLAAEFRALRATVLRLWTRAGHAVAGDDLVRFNEAIDQALAESIEAYADKEDEARALFLGVLGHDLRAPLATIGAAGEWLVVQSPATSTSTQLGNSIKRATRHMGGMIDNLMNYTRVQVSGGLAKRSRMTDMAAICDDAIIDARASFPATEFEFAVVGDPRGMFDPVTLRQLITNLFVNAAQHGDRDSPVRAELRAEGDRVTLSVANRGRVIPERDLAKLFRPLVRLAGPETAGPGRTSLGLGLFIAQAIAASHGGEIVATSLKDGVTQFVVTLPLARLKLPLDTSPAN
jgi:signal transduction histidine kinase